jgi:hypothetical protein
VRRDDPNREYLLVVADAIGTSRSGQLEAWELTEHVHRIRPDLKPPFVAEYEEDRVRHKGLPGAVFATSSRRIICGPLRISSWWAAA